MEDEDGKSFDQRFRDIQKACREMPQGELQSYRERRTILNERVRAGLQVFFEDECEPAVAAIGMVMNLI